LRCGHDPLSPPHVPDHRSGEEPQLLRGARDGVPPRASDRARWQLEATNYFFGFPGQEEKLELTLNHDGRSYELGTASGHIAIGVDDLDATLGRLAEQGIEPEREPYRVREGGSRLCFVQDPDG
jgi:catechol 2,3-dioxygenase-like lactoylglutathione lyase family enzyme